MGDRRQSVEVESGKRPAASGLTGSASAVASMLGQGGAANASSMGVLRRVLVLVGLVMADRATCGRPQQAMVACEVSGGGADRRSFASYVSSLVITRHGSTAQ